MYVALENNNTSRDSIYGDEYTSPLKKRVLNDNLTVKKARKTDNIPLVDVNTTIPLKREYVIRNVLITRKTRSSQKLAWVDCGLGDKTTTSLKKLDDNPNILLFRTTTSSQEMA